jgi:hypothetical protein
MNTRYAIRHSFALMITLAILAGCDPAGTISQRYVADSPTVFSFQESLLGRYGAQGHFSVNGLIDDEGTVETQFLEWSNSSGVERIRGIKTMTGTKGTITLEFEGHLVSEGKHLEGTFRIIEGTGSYANLSGEGSFDMALDMMPGTTTMSGVYEGRVQRDS